MLEPGGRGRQVDTATSVDVFGGNLNQNRFGTWRRGGVTAAAETALERHGVGERSSLAPPSSSRYTLTLPPTG